MLGWLASNISNHLVQVSTRALKPFQKTRVTSSEAVASLFFRRMIDYQAENDVT
jgi:hypothetical protein